MTEIDYFCMEIIIKAALNMAKTKLQVLHNKEEVKIAYANIVLCLLYCVGIMLPIATVMVL